MQLTPVRRQARVSALLIPFLLLAGASAASAAPIQPQRVTSVEGITEYSLPNGLRVLLFPDPSKQTVTVNITYLVGSRHENYGETGMAHLLEHLLFKGTPRHPNVPKELTEHGARPNGTTWFDRTNYFETFQSTEENLKWALDLEADRMVNSFIAKKDLDTEMTVVRNEMESGENNPSRILFQRMMSTAFIWHNYGKSTIGARSDVESVPIERLQAFYRRYYQPDNAVLIVAGKFDEAKALKLIAEKFGKIPRPKRVLQPTYTDEPVQDGERTVTLRRVGDVHLVGALYHVPSGAHPDATATTLLSLILGDTPSGRLHKNLVETRLAASAYGFQMLMKDPGVFVAGAEVRQDGNPEKAREKLLEVVEGIAQAKIASEEVERARTKILKGIDLTLNDPEQLGIQLSESIAKGDWRLFFLSRDRVQKVTIEDVQRVAQSYLKPSNRTLGVFVPTQKPERAEIPSAPELATLLKDYKGNAAVSQGEAFDPSPANIESRTKRTTLPGGLKLALLPKKTRGSTVNATLQLRFGSLEGIRGRSREGGFVPGLLNRGTKKRDRQQIQDEFDRLKARVGFGGDSTGVSVSIETLRENFPAVLKLVAEILREPSFPKAEFEQMREEALADIEKSRSEPQSVGSNFYSRLMNPFPKDDPRYVGTFDEQIEEINSVSLSGVKEYYEDFYGASNGEFAAVGDFDESGTAKLLTDLLGSWKSPRKYARIPTEYRDIQAVAKTFETPDKANAFFLAGMKLQLRDDDADYPALVLGNYMLGGGFLNSRLATRVRQKEGLSYTIGSQFSASSLDKAGSFLSYAIYAPQNATRLEAAWREELKRAIEEKFTASEIREAKSGFLQAQQVARAQDGGLAGRLAGYLFLDRTFQWNSELESKISALTADQVQSALKRHIDLGRISVIKAGDFTKKTKP